MASFLDKFKIQTATPNKQSFDLSCQHITSSDFMELSPVYIKEMVPNESISINMETFSRTAPMEVPTFGRCNINNRAFFVPMRTIFKGWNDFITDTQHIGADNTNGIPAKVPYFNLGDLATMFFYATGTTTGTSYDGYFGKIYADEPNSWDLYLQSGQDSKYIVLNAKGRQALKILQSLGYQYVGDENQNGEYTGYNVSALPLLAFVKVYIDWYYPSQYYDDVTRIALEKICQYDAAATVAHNITVADLVLIFNNLVFVNYDSDYFVSAFESPVGPAYNAASYTQSSVISLKDITDNSGTGHTNNTIMYNNTSTVGTPGLVPFLRLSDGSTVATANTKYMHITQYGIDALKSLTDYIKRHQLVGSRALDRYMARFGINLPSEKLNRSVYIGMQNVPLQIGDVMSNSDTTPDGGASLGAYAGKGLAFGGSDFDYQTDEFGYIIIMNSIVPTIGYYQGIDRSILHLSRLDFYTPEFDQLGNQAISAMELYVDQDPTSNVMTNLSTKVFGFTPRYAEYKIGRDRLTGDYRLGTKKVGITSNAWHLMREFDDDSFGNSATNVVVSPDFVRGVDSGQYNRIFNVVDRSADHFFLIHNFNIKSWAPMKRLYDTYDFDSEGDSKIMDVNGVKVN